MNTLLPTVPPEPRSCEQRHPQSAPSPLPSLAIEGFTCAIRPKKIALSLTLVVLALGLASTFARLAAIQIGPDRYRGVMEIVSRFDLDHEINVPTWYASTALFVAAGLLALIAMARKQDGCRFAVHWAFLAVVFLFLSLDEAANLHEILIVPLRRRLDARGPLFFAWVIPGAMFVAAIGLAFRRFLLEHLDRRTRWHFVVAGAIYVGGALGMEMVGGACADWYGLDSLRYLAAMTVEEVMEMLGIVLLIYALLTYLQQRLGPCQIRLL